MSQQSVIEELQHLGMSGYEAKAYVALVAAGTPLNGYEVAKHSGVPRSTVYETLGKLVGRGAVAQEDAVPQRRVGQDVAPALEQIARPEARRPGAHRPRLAAADRADPEG